MPTPRELYQAGQLQAAIQALTAEVKANPADGPGRIFLFELLSFAGDWDRAQKQIEVLGQAGPRGSGLPGQHPGRAHAATPVLGGPPSPLPERAAPVRGPPPSRHQPDP